jgi:hypothetical protein
MACCVPLLLRDAQQSPLLVASIWPGRPPAAVIFAVVSQGDVADGCEAAVVALPASDDLSPASSDTLDDVEEGRLEAGQTSELSVCLLDIKINLCMWGLTGRDSNCYTTCAPLWQPAFLGCAYDLRFLVKH